MLWRVDYSRERFETMIYILDNDQAKCAAMIDDKSLSDMISDCAQVLVNAAIWTKDLREPFIPKSLLKKHGDKAINVESITTHEVPKRYDEWVHWCRECLANYNALLAYAQECCEEWAFRFSDDCRRFKHVNSAYCGSCKREHKYHDVIVWCEQNKPDLPNTCDTCKGEGEYYRKWHEDTVKCIFCKSAAKPFPLVMPDEYKVYKLRELGNGQLITQEYLNKIAGEFFSGDKESYLDAAESYRAYYRARLRKMARKIQCDNEGCIQGQVPDYSRCRCCLDSKDCHKCNGEGYITQAPTWSRRSKPEWLGDL